MRFQKSFKVLPGLRLNLSRSGLGLSAGVKGLHAGIDGRGRQYVNAGIPGTGISTRKYIRSSPAAIEERRQVVTVPAPGRQLALAVLGAIGTMILILVGWVISAGSSPSASPSPGAPMTRPPESAPQSTPAANPPAMPAGSNIYRRHNARRRRSARN